MQFIARLCLAAAGSLLSFTASADIADRDLPGDTVWYLHANLGALRDSEAGSKLFLWFEDEVASEVREKSGIDLGTEVDTLTAFATTGESVVVVVDGPLTKATQDKIMALAASEGPVDPRNHKGKDYFHFGKEGAAAGNDLLDGLEDSAYVSFAVPGKAIVTGKEGQMQSLLDNGGKITGGGKHNGALLVLSANKNFVQAGMHTRGMTDDGDDDWESNILRNTEQAALLVAEQTGSIAVEAKLVSTDPKMAQAIGAIVNGLLGLQSFNSELPAELRDLIRNTRVGIVENTLSLSTVLDPAVLTRLLNAK